MMRQVRHVLISGIVDRGQVKVNYYVGMEANSSHSYY